MSERPIPFIDRLVRAILDERKTVTRRVVTDGTSQGNWRASELLLDRAYVDPGPSPAGNPGPYLKAPLNVDAIAGRRGWAREDVCAECVDRLYPRWFAGDRLWVRETWAVGRGYDDVKPRDLPKHLPVWYRADGKVRCRGEYIQPGVMTRGKWRPPMFMPRWVSRISLETEDVDAQRLQAITDGSALAEGIEGGVPGQDIDIDGGWWPDAPRRVFRELWDSINAARGFGWDANPWVWVIRFRRLA